MPYVLPTPTTWVSDDYWGHRNRTPPSSEAGTDYGCGYGSAVFAPCDGTVVDVKQSNSGGGGRHVAIDFSDGRRGRTLHMSQTWVTIGQWVRQGQQVGLSGASGYGDDWYYGPHAHETLWDGWYYAFGDGATIDFEPFLGSSPPSPGPTPGPTPIEEDSMLYLLQIDPNSDGRWFLADFGAGTAQRIYNGLQLDLIKRDPNVNQVFGGQPLDVLTGLTIRGE